MSAPPNWAGYRHSAVFVFMVLESPKNNRQAFKRCVLQEAAALPVEGYVYEIFGCRKLAIVLIVSRKWVHVVTLDLHTATSYDFEWWVTHAEKGLVCRTNDPWNDLSEVRKSLFHE